MSFIIYILIFIITTSSFTFFNIEKINLNHADNDIIYLILIKIIWFLPEIITQV